ncbi:CopD family protein [Acidovorax sp. SUPP2539]|uniref:CopD family protein n=1 Tax=Acidovorax sp. SUPP2539 TaxID=2920878 RepID=UPI0023DE4DC7|nr:CopD family protein [Acidovorax sp. SUPP2539]GKS90692.1 CopD family protein [Acidovorax sp. SUPP2539]
MTYLWIKGLHVGAALIFVGGLLLLSVVASRWPAAGGVLLPHEKRLGTAVLQWDRRVTAPSMALVWVLGLGLAAGGGWIGQGWLFGKMALVIALSAIHGVMSATLRRRLQSETGPQPSLFRHGPTAVAALSAAIAVLVTVKP